MGWGQACRRKITSKIYRKIKQWFEARKKCTMTSGCSIFFVFPPLLFSRRRSIDTGLFYWAASRHRLFLYSPVSRCACGREGVRPDLPLPGWEATDKHGGGRAWKEVAERWKVSVLVVVGGEIFKEQAGRKGSSCRMGKESWPAGGCLEGGRAGSGSGFG